MTEDGGTAEWGRIDDDGTVWVRTAQGERAVGSWQAGDKAAGLAYFARRFADLATEVGLLERRLESGAGDPASTRASAMSLKEQLPNAAVIGDLAGLDARIDALLAACDEKAAAAAAARQEARQAAIEAKEALVAEAEQIATSSSAWKASGDRLRAIVDEWRQIRGVDRRTDEALWKRFAAARDAFAKRRSEHFAALDVERGEARAAKERLVARAEELSASSDWKETATAMRALMTEWKAAGRAGREDENELWSRFRAAQDAFFSRRSAVFAERDAAELDNQHRKERIVERAERLDLTDPQAAQAALRELQVQYDEIGRVPRDAMRRVDDRMRAAEQRVREALDAKWRRGRAESNPFFVELRDRLAEAEAKLTRAQASGDPERIARAEAEVQRRRALLPH